MNLHSLARQRLYLLICSVVGLISVFLPWVTVSAGMFGVSMSQSTNGFRGNGVAVFVCFIVLIGISLLGEQSKPLSKSSWLVSLVVVSIALLLLVISFVNGGGGDGFGIVEASRGFGLYIAIASGLAALASIWVYKEPGYDLASSFENLKKDVPFRISDQKQPGSHSNSAEKLTELEKLFEMKSKGLITEDEYSSMKSKIISGN